MKEYVKDCLGSMPHCVKPATPSYQKYPFYGHQIEIMKNQQKINKIKIFQKTVFKRLDHLFLAHFETVPMNGWGDSAHEFIFDLNMYQSSLKMLLLIPYMIYSFKTSH